MPMRRFSAGSCAAALPTTAPARRISPARTGSSPATVRNRVVLPQPEGPISTPISPARRPNDTSSTAGRGRPAYWTLNFETSTNMQPIVDAYNSHLHQLAFPTSHAMRARRLQDLFLLLVAALLVLPVLAILGSWLQWDGR